MSPLCFLIDRASGLPFVSWLVFLENSGEFAEIRPATAEMRPAAAEMRPFAAEIRPPAVEMRPPAAKGIPATKDI
jgi:hypothetical protein